MRRVVHANLKKIQLLTFLKRSFKESLHFAHLISRRDYHRLSGCIKGASQRKDEISRDQVRIENNCRSADKDVVRL